jgi:uncharacterized membrane protein YkvI
MNNIIFLIIIYILGFILTLVFFKLFGKKIDFDYSGKKDTDYDDWESNAQAYTAFSIGWIIIIPVLLICGLWKTLLFIVKKFIKD